MSIETIKKKHSRYINAIIKCASEVSGFSATSNIDETLFIKISARLKEKNNNKFKNHLRYIWSNKLVKEYVIGAMKGGSIKLNQLPNKSSSDAVSKVASINSISTDNDNTVTKSQIINESNVKNTELDGIKTRLSSDSTVQKAESEKKKIAPIKSYTSINNSNSKKYNIKNFTLIEIVKDGNCAFRASAYLLYNDQHLHGPIRQNVVNFVVNNWEDNKMLVNATREAVDRSTFETAEDYIKCMGRDGEFGTSFEIGVIVKLYKINIEILHQVGNEYQLVAPMTNPTVSNEKPGYFLFTGSWTDGHIHVLKENEEITDTRLNVEDDTITNSKELNDHDETISLVQPIKSNDTNASEKLEERVSNFIGKNSNPETLEKPAQYEIYNFEEDDDNKVIEPFRCDKKIAENNKLKESDSEKSETNKTEVSQSSEDSDKGNSPKHVEDSSSSENDSKLKLLTEESPQSSEDNSEVDSETAKQSGSNERKKPKPKRKIHQKSNDDIKTEYKIKIGQSLVEAKTIEKEKIHKSLTRKEIRRLMFTWKCCCPLFLLGTFRENKGNHWVLYGFCKNEAHEANYRYDIFLKLINNNRYYDIHCSSDKDISLHCSQTKNRKFPQVRGDEREAMKETLKISSVRDVYYKDIETTNEDMFWRGDTGKVRDMNVYYKIRSEDKQQRKSDEYCTECHEIVKLYLNLRKQSDSPMPSLSFPLKINMYNKNQLAIVDASSLPVVLYVCATLAGCVVPEFLGIEDIMYYALLYDGTKSKVPIAELVTMDNREQSLQQFWIDFKTFVFEETRRWPYFNILIVDWQWQLIQSIVETWNKQSVIKYVEDVYKYITQVDPLPNMSIIMCCSDSVMRKISSDLDRYSLNAKAHVFYLKSITLLTLCRDLEEIEMIINDLFKIMLYKSEEKISQSVIIIENLIKENESTIKEILVRASELSVGGKELRNNMRILNKYESGFPDEIQSLFHKKINPNWIARKTAVSNDEEPIDDVSNDLYAPNVGEYFMKHFVPWLPFVTKILKGPSKLKMSLCLNSFVNDYICEYNHSILKNFNKWTVTNLCEILIDNVKFRVNENRISLREENPEIEIGETLMDPEPASDPLVRALWGRKKSDIKKQQRKKRKITYKEGKDFIPIKRNKKEIKIESKTITKDAKVRQKTKSKVKTSKCKETKNVTNKSEAHDLESESVESSDSEILENEKNIIQQRRKKYSHIRKMLHRSDDDSSSEENDNDFTKKKTDNKKGEGIIPLNQKKKIVESKLVSRNSSDSENFEDPTNSTLKCPEEDSSKMKTVNLSNNTNNVKAVDSNRENHDKIETKNFESKQVNTKNSASSLGEKVKHEQLKIMKNGLIDDIDYYKNHESENINVAHFEFAKERVAIFKTYDINLKMMHSVIDKKGWIDGQAIDVYIANLIEDNDNITYLPTDMGGSILGRREEIRWNKKMKILSLSENVGNLILMPYVFINHWRLLVIDTKNESLELLDPYERTGERMERVQEKLTEYFKNCQKESSMRKLHHVQWVITSSRKDRPYQNDDASCGIYVTYYIECILKNEKFEEKFDPEKYRLHMAKEILRNSQSVANKCLYCWAHINEKNKQRETTCRLCHRVIHTKCVKRYLRNKCKDAVKTFQDEKSTADNTFSCFLCERYMKDFKQSC